jgi:hypothetical protein
MDGGVAGRTSIRASSLARGVDNRKSVKTSVYA